MNESSNYPLNNLYQPNRQSHLNIQIQIRIWNAIRKCSCVYSNWPSLGQHLIYSFRLWAAPWALWVIWHLYFALSSSSLRWWECNCSERTIMVSATISLVSVPLRYVTFRFVSIDVRLLVLLSKFQYCVLSISVRLLNRAWCVSKMCVFTLILIFYSMYLSLNVTFNWSLIDNLSTLIDCSAVNWSCSIIIEILWRPSTRLAILLLQNT